MEHGTPITRAEALRIAREILKTAERERAEDMTLSEYILEMAEKSELDLTSCNFEKFQRDPLPEWLVEPIRTELEKQPSKCCCGFCTKLDEACRQNDLTRTT